MGRVYINIIYVGANFSNKHMKLHILLELDNTVLKFIWKNKLVRLVKA